MSERKVVHEIRLERSVKVILAAAILVLALQAFGPALAIKSAYADLVGGIRANPFTVDFTCHGCTN